MQKAHHEDQILSFSMKQTVRCLSYLINSDTQIFIVTDNAAAIYDISQANIVVETNLNPNVLPLWCKNITSVEDHNQYFFVQGKMGTAQLYKLECIQIPAQHKQMVQQQKNGKKLVLIDDIQIEQPGFTKIRFHQHCYSNQGIIKYQQNLKITMLFTVNEEKHQIFKWVIQTLQNSQTKKLVKDKQYLYDEEIQVNLNAIRSFTFNECNYAVLGLEGFQILLFKLDQQDQELQPIKFQIPTKNKQDLIIYSIQLLSDFMFAVTLRREQMAILKWSQNTNQISIFQRIEPPKSYHYTLPVSQQLVLMNSKYSIGIFKFNIKKIKQYKQTDKKLQPQASLSKQQQILQQNSLFSVQDVYQIVSPKLYMNISLINFQISDFCIKNKNQGVPKRTKIIGCTQNKKVFFLQTDLL